MRRRIITATATSVCNGWWSRERNLWPGARSMMEADKLLGQGQCTTASPIYLPLNSHQASSLHKFQPYLCCLYSIDWFREYRMNIALFLFHIYYLHNRAKLESYGARICKFTKPICWNYWDHISQQNFKIPKGNWPANL